MKRRKLFTPAGVYIGRLWPRNLFTAGEIKLQRAAERGVRRKVRS